MRAGIGLAVSEEDNVRWVLAKIELGEGDAAIVYVTDAVASGLVETVAIPDEANVPATYATVANIDAPHPGLASESCLSSRESRHRRSLPSLGSCQRPGLWDRRARGLT